MSGPKPDHSPKPSMDLKMTGPVADQVNRENFAARQAAVTRYGTNHVAQHASGKGVESRFSAEASAAFKHAATAERGNPAKTEHEGRPHTLTREFNRAAAPIPKKAGMER
jgi:hypothetical protein